MQALNAGSRAMMQQQAPRSGAAFSRQCRPALVAPFTRISRRAGDRICVQAVATGQGQIKLFSPSKVSG